MFPTRPGVNATDEEPRVRRRLTGAPLAPEPEPPIALPPTPMPGTGTRPRDLPAPDPGAVGQAGPSASPSRATPSQPTEPSPVASLPPAPFAPMQAGMQPTMGRMLFGRAGGLLGGGIGVPGALGDEGSSPEADALMLLMQYLSSGR